MVFLINWMRGSQNRAIQDELAQLRSTLSQAPLMIWREAAEGEVIWANAAYLLQAAHHLEPGQDLSWPLPRLFERISTAQDGPPQRQRLAVPGKPDRWFSLTVKPEGEGWLVYAQPADAVVQAETALRDFTQTLTKTFAHLPIGLAIFDRQRQFHPAVGRRLFWRGVWWRWRQGSSWPRGLRRRGRICQRTREIGQRRRGKHIEQGFGSGIEHDQPGGKTRRARQPLLCHRPGAAQRQISEIRRGGIGRRDWSFGFRGRQQIGRAHV